MLELDRLDFKKGGGVVVVVTQDARSGAVLMVAHADRQALELTLKTGEMHYRSRARGLWRKGAVSGNTQQVVTLDADCDGDAVLVRVIPAGPACHTGARSCFGDRALAADALGELDRTIERRLQSRPGEAPPAGGDEPVEVAGGVGGERPSYTRRLLADRNLRLKKIGEEAAELVTALADDDRARAAEEGVDLLYHALVALRASDVTLEALREILAGRAK